MQLRAVLLLVVALIFGGVTVYLVNDYLRSETGMLQPVERQELVSVVVAKQDLQSGTRLSPEILKVVQVTPDALPKEAFADVASVIGKSEEGGEGAAPILLREVHENEPIVKYSLSPYGARGGLPTKIPEDMRAVTIPVNEILGVAGFVLPGHYVDVMHVTSEGRADEKLVARIILQNAKVLGVDQSSSESGSEPMVVNAVTLLVTPFDGQRLALAQRLGTLVLALRNEFDASLIEESVVTYKDLLTIEKDRSTKVYKRVRRPKVEIIRGLNVEQKTVDETSEGNTKTDGGAGK